jgi:hypothetical protein
MTKSICRYPGDRDEALIAFLYDDGDPAARASFAAHLAECPPCRGELEALRGVRGQLAHWAPPEPNFANRQSTSDSPQSATRDPHWWSQVPVWAQVAAAMLFLGVSAGVANLDVHYDANGLSVRTGWSQPARDARVGEAAKAVAPASDIAAVDPAPWRADLAALEQQMKTEIKDAAAASALARAASASDTEVLRRVRALVDDSEKREQRELALRVAEVLRDVNSQRQADLVKIDRSLGAVQNNLGVEVMKQRQSLNLLYRASQRQ